MKNFDMELILSIFGYLLCLLAGVFWVGPGTISPVFLALSAFLLVVVYVSVHPIGRKMRRLLARMFTKEDDEIAVTKQHKAIFRLLMLLAVMFTSFVTTSQAQSLLIDVSVNNTTPGASDVVTYRIRYRCASSINHCYNSHITFTLPDALEIVGGPGIGGNVANTTITGNAVDVYLVSPPAVGAPAGALAAGASGILETRARFRCGVNGTAPIPAAGTTINFTAGPTFSVTGGSVTANTGNTNITVPTVNACPPPPPPAPPATNLSKRIESSPNVVSLQPILPASSTQWPESYYHIEFPAVAAGTYYVEDDLANGADLWIEDITGDANPNIDVEIFAAGSWYALHTFDGTWTNGVPLGGQLRDDGGNLIPSVFYSYQSPSFGKYISGVDKIRWVITGPTPARTLNLDFAMGPNSVPGEYVNCLTTDNPAWTSVCSQRLVLTDKPTLAVSVFGTDFFNLGKSSLTSIEGGNLYTISGNPGLYKDPNDAVMRLTIQGYKLDQTGGVLETLLPAGFVYSTDPLKSNFWFEENFSGNSCLLGGASFTAIPNYNGTGRMLLRWAYPPRTCSSNFTYTRIWFSARYVGTDPLPASLTFNVTGKTYNGDQAAYLINNQGNNPFSASLVCSSTTPLSEQTLFKPTSGGDFNSIKWVKGVLDSDFSRYPLSGNTNLAGDGTYEIYISSADWENAKQIDVADILPFVGDEDMLNGATRGSAWSAELASGITVERYKYGAGLQPVSSGDLPFGIQYTTSTNPCYLDGPQPTGQVRADVTLANEGQMPSCVDFSMATPAAGARGFLFRWVNTADPLQFGEYLKITVPIRQLTGEADNLSGGVAWNSVAFTATEVDNDEFLSSEPLKVGLKMIDQSTTAAIGDYVWLDGNANGRQDVGEAPISGVVVSLYDAAGQPVTQSVTIGGIPTNVPVTAVTNTAGYYCFPGLVPNTNYYVRLENTNNFGSGGNLSQYALTSANNANDDVDSDATLGTLAGSSATLRPQILAPTLGSGTQTKTYDFGFICPGNISGYVWMDNDLGGDQDGGEMALSGINVTLRNAATNAAIGATVTTNASGGFTFSNIPSGTYYVEFSGFPAGKIPTFKDLTGNDNNDSDVGGNGRTDVFVLGSCDNFKFDLGLRNPPANPATICGTAWDDLNKDGTFQVTEPGIANITVNLLDVGGFVLNSTITDSNGDYCFTNLDPNIAYQVAFVLPPTGMMFSVAGPDQDVNTSTGVTTTTYTPTDNQTINDVDAGFMGSVSIGNQVWLDANNNGLFDSGEAIFANIEMRLIAANGSTVLATTTTDANGRYVFKNLAADTYYVEAAVPATYSSSTDIVTSATPNAVDSDDNGAGSPSGGYIRSGAITLANDGGTPGSANWTETDHGVFIMGMLDPASNPKAYYTVDFGFLIPPPCTNPTATADADDATCVSGVAQSDGKITILSFTAGQRFRYSSGNTFNSGTATAMAVIPVGGVIVSNLPNITSDYTVRIFDAIDDNCYVDRVVTITLVVCCVNPSGITFSQSVPTCTGASANNNGTISLSSVTNGTHYGVSTLNAGSYNGPVFASATPIPGGLPIVIQSSISNTGGAYIVRTFNGSNDCYTDQTVTVTPVVCMCSPVPCGTTTAVKN